jgi:transcriptional regulator with XRE-family HTH domain
MAEDAPRRQLEALGEFIRTQRQSAELTLRELAARTNVSNPYLSQIERGLHEPSVRVLKAIAGALNVSAESLLVQAGLIEASAGGEGAVPTVVDAVRADPRLNDDQRRALLSVYRSFVDAPDDPSDAPRPAKTADEQRPGGKGAARRSRSSKGSGKQG